uniref:CCC domain-containing protein n=1 Tax=Anopheles melas TaxID=34690 RepID=A0A182TYY3_9DIPT
MTLAISRLLPVLVFVCGACLSQVARAALATNEVHLPEEQSTHRHHAHHAGQKESPEVHGGKVTYASPNPVAVYHIEHNQSESGARQYLAGMVEAELRVPAWCKQCNETVMEYCRSGRFLNDHCCCENSYAIGKRAVKAKKRESFLVDAVVVRKAAWWRDVADLHTSGPRRRKDTVSY